MVPLLTSNCNNSSKNHNSRSAQELPCHQMPLRHPLLRNSTVDVTESTLTTNAPVKTITGSNAASQLFTPGAGASSSTSSSQHQHHQQQQMSFGNTSSGACGGGAIATVSSTVKLTPNKLPQQHSLPQAIFRRQHAIDILTNSSSNNSPLGRSSIPIATPTIILSPNNSLDSAPSIPEKTKQRLKQEQWGTSSRQASSLNSSIHSNGDIRSCKNRSRKSSLKSLFDLKESAKKRFSVIPQVSLVVVASYFRFHSPKSGLEGASQVHFCLAPCYYRDQSAQCYWAKWSIN